MVVEFVEDGLEEPNNAALFADGDGRRIARLPGLEKILSKLRETAKYIFSDLTQRTCRVELGTSNIERVGIYPDSSPGLMLKSFEFTDTGDQGAIVVEPGLVWATCDATLSLRTEGAPRGDSRMPTRVEFALMRNVFDRLFACLEESFHELSVPHILAGKTRLLASESCSELASTQILRTDLNITLDDSTSRLTLMLPVSMIRSFRALLSVAPMRSSESVDARWGRELSQCVGMIGVPLRAILDQFTLPMRTICDLSKGDIFPLRVTEVDSVMLMSLVGPICQCALENDGSRYGLRPSDNDFAPKTNRRGLSPMSDIKQAVEAMEDNKLRTPDEQANGAPTKQEPVNRTELVMGIPINIQVVLGTTVLPVSSLMKLSRESIVELDQRVGDPVEIFANGCLIARGEIVVLDEDRSRYGRHVRRAWQCRLRRQIPAGFEAARRLVDVGGRSVQRWAGQQRGAETICLPRDRQDGRERAGAMDPDGGWFLQIAPSGGIGIRLQRQHSKHWSKCYHRL